MAKKKAIKRVFCFFVILAILMSAMPTSIFAITSNVANASGMDETVLGTYEDSNVFSHVKALSLTSRTVSEVPKEEWNKTFGSTGDDEAWTVQQTDDGGYVLAGDTLFETGLCSAWLVKTNSQGEKEWEKSFRGTGFDSACSVQQTDDSGYILAGDTLFETGLCTAWLLKTNSKGEKEWEQTFRGTGFDSASSVQQTTDGGYILAGNTLFETGLCSAWLVKTNSQGDMEWEKSFGITGFDSVSSVQQTTDGGYILAGDTLSSDAGLTAAWLVKTNSQGEVKWEATFGGTGLDFAYAVEQTADGGYIIAGERLSFYIGLCTAWLVKTNSKGIKEWEKTYGETGLDSAYAVQQTIDGGYVFAGETFSLGAYGWTDAWLVKTDSEGNVEWEKTIGGSGDDLASAVQQTADGGYVIAGCTDSYSDGYYDAWLIKVKGTTELTEFPDLTLENPGFESGELDPWYSTKYYDPYKKCDWINIGVDSEARYEGDYGAYIDIRCSLDAWGRIIQEPVEITPGESLAVEAKLMYKGDLSDGYAELWLVFLDEDKKALDHVYKKYYESDFGAEDKWLSAVLPATTAPSNAKYVRVMVGLADVKSCRLNIDDVMLKSGSAIGNHPPTATKIEPTSDSITIEPGESQEFKVKAEDVDEEEHNNLKMIEWFVDDVRMETGAADGTVAEACFTHTFEDVGTFTIKAIAYDEQMEVASVTWDVYVWLPYSYFVGKVLVGSKEYDVYIDTDTFIPQEYISMFCSEIFDPTLSKSISCKISIVIKNTKGEIVSDKAIEELVILALIWRTIAEEDLWNRSPEERSDLEDVIGDRNNPIFFVQWLKGWIQDDISTILGQPDKKAELYKNVLRDIANSKRQSKLNEDVADVLISMETVSELWDDYEKIAEGALKVGVVTSKDLDIMDKFGKNIRLHKNVDLTNKYSGGTIATKNVFKMFLLLSEFQVYADETVSDLQLIHTFAEENNIDLDPSLKIAMQEIIDEYSAYSSFDEQRANNLRDYLLNEATDEVLAKGSNVILRGVCSHLSGHGYTMLSGALSSVALGIGVSQLVYNMDELYENLGESKLSYELSLGMYEIERPLRNEIKNSEKVDVDAAAVLKASFELGKIALANALSKEADAIDCCIIGNIKDVFTGGEISKKKKFLRGVSNSITEYEGLAWKRNFNWLLEHVYSEE